MLKPPRHPYGFKNLLVYKKAEELQMECSRVTAQFPKYKTLIALADQMDRSARSTKQNIVEGWKRNSTKEYYDFLGFSIGANTELEEDCNDIWRGAYPDLMGLKGIMEEKGKGMGKMGEEKGVMGITGEMGIPSTPSTPSLLLDVEKIPFHPLDKNLPPVIQLKLRCKELNYLLNQLQKSLELKMLEEKTLSSNDMARNRNREIQKEQKAFENILEDFGMERLENGQIITKNKND